jgi:hypothetical protein
MHRPALEQGERERWLERALDALRESGSLGQASADYIGRKHVQLGFARQKHSGAIWFTWRRLRFGIYLNAAYTERRPEDPHIFALLAHEAKHLEQGIVEALSVQGELAAWQLHYDVLAQSGARPADHLWGEIRALDPGSRADLKRARSLIGRYAGPGYRIGWLPVWPLPAEVAYWLRALTRRKPRQAEGRRRAPRDRARRG